jgi:hypothetical protein
VRSRRRARSSDSRVTRETEAASGGMGVFRLIFALPKL